MRVTIVSQIYAPAANGQAVFTRHLAEGLVERGHDVQVILASERLRGYREQRRGVDLAALFAVPMGVTDAYLTPAPLIGLRRLFNEFQPEVVHLQDHYPLCRYAFGFARRRGIPVIGTNHFMPENIIHYLLPLDWARRLATKALWWTMTSLYDQLDAVTTPTRTAAALLEEAGLEVPVRPISCGVNLRDYRPDLAIDAGEIRARYGLHREGPVLLYVGRIDEEKRLDVLLKAIARLEDDLQLAITGVGRYEAEIRDLVAELELEERVVFTGFVPEEQLAQLVQSADIFAMPSAAELQSIATLEAMALGKPIVAAAARALPELVEPGVNGYLFRPGDPVDAADRLRQMLRERDRWESMGQHSRRLVEPHDLAQTIKAYEGLYRTLLEREAAPQGLQAQTSQ